MIASAIPLDAVAAAVAVLLSVGLTLHLLHRRSRPAAGPLLGVALALTAASALHLATTAPVADALSRVLPIGVRVDGWWVIQGATVGTVAGGLWALFALAYVGRGRRLFVAVAGAVAVLSTAAITVTFLAASRGRTAAHVDALALCYLATAILAAVGIGLLMLASVRQNAFPVAEPLLLSAGAVALLSGVQLAQVIGHRWLFPGSLAVASAALLVPVVRYPLFDTLPAARVAGRDRVFDALSAGVIVVDEADRVRDLNDRAASLFDLEPDAVQGAALDEVLGFDLDLETLATAREGVRTTTADHRTLALTTTPIRGSGARQYGHVLVCSDVTDRRVREEQLALLRRFVVDVVGTRMETAATTATAAADQCDAGTSPTAAADRIWENATAVTRLVASARAVERGIDTGDGRASDGPTSTTTSNGEAIPARDLRATVRHAAASAEMDVSPPPSIDPADGPLRTTLPTPLVRTILETVLDDVARRDPSGVDLRVAASERPSIEVLATFETAPETDLPSIPIARLAIERAGGRVSTSTPGAASLRLSMELPGTGAAESRPPAATATRSTPSVTRSRGRSAAPDDDPDGDRP
ncbi:PAS/PAC sensor protein [Salinarchaeum sp. Harcht-Bsk1]|uniref:PAS domain-containing protein n=1 Tax=Salinarchaeum sp. Harcht-Bsk1 TaxID=1333523 RepID=UPI0003423BAF|nr:PAS domain-containing protein [Salinarchaeum sp. Harcht-Bsk1]AGN00855.1 PAS/PAC sensor protein [Salinarchaeum sp. Harcht-Bsk1]